MPCAVKIAGDPSSGSIAVSSRIPPFPHALEIYDYNVGNNSAGQSLLKCSFLHPAVFSSHHVWGI
ncbi:MAG: hypothetical protein ACQXXJ_01140 [Candidatus Bathyarchaeia archaeon]